MMNDFGNDRIGKLGVSLHRHDMDMLMYPMNPALKLALFTVLINFNKALIGGFGG